jgi:hypothetical protein
MAGPNVRRTLEWVLRIGGAIAMLLSLLGNSRSWRDLWLGLGVCALGTWIVLSAEESRYSTRTMRILGGGCIATGLMQVLLALR